MAITSNIKNEKDFNSMTVDELLNTLPSMNGTEKIVLGYVKSNPGTLKSILNGMIEVAGGNLSVYSDPVTNAMKALVEKIDIDELENEFLSKKITLEEALFVETFRKCITEGTELTELTPEYSMFVLGVVSVVEKLYEGNNSEVWTAVMRSISKEDILRHSSSIKDMGFEKDSDIMKAIIAMEKKLDEIYDPIEDVKEDIKNSKKKAKSAFEKAMESANNTADDAKKELEKTRSNSSSMGGGSSDCGVGCYIGVGLGMLAVGAVLYFGYNHFFGDGVSEDDNDITIID